ncbi:16S rRNA (uracil(1498)-N(3))-methyltransferase [Rhodoplanes sp. Z2-YC6860]|uniref:16S rRNA (uracil(1498)-N(3))-methyltransferase n=1 Tax=Rhodoplanes sp. Z2-YC6860 TaxID=674703 RepID=UPI00078C2F87|nr:16S rRNA (uracil(1498)-N(3))-methyltransferase [Rhodoplanes sp. Z2-YC6860]AMN39962.1 16S ribosomal RNA methyltransferase RsmE [Rhodoplanes sp. Z2-YC6860]
MARYDFRTPRLFVNDALAPGAEIALEKPQAHYLTNVLRLKPGDPVLAFNGKDGEWRATVTARGKTTTLSITEQTREQTEPCDLHYLFAPLKHERLDYMVQKAVELGVSRLQPVLTQHTQVTRVNLDRMRANAIEAAEQCGVLTVPEIGEPLSFGRALAAREAERLLVFCDEDADVKDPLKAMADARQSPSAMLPLTMADAGSEGRQPIALLIGPEGGFSEEERAVVLKLTNMVRLSLGPRILRADTAAVAALALVQAVLGDWR